MAALATWALSTRLTPLDGGVTRATILTPPGVNVGAVDGTLDPVTISADGRRIVFVGQTGVGQQLYSRLLEDPDATAVEGTQGIVNAHFVSPNGEWVAFYDAGDRALKKVRVTGGPPLTVCDIAGFFFSGAWGADGTIVLATSDQPGLQQVSAVGGTLRPLTTPGGGDVHAQPQFLPDGRGLVLTIGGRGATAAPSDRVAVYRFDTGDLRSLIDGHSPRVVDSGHLVFARAGVIWAAPFDLDALQVTGEPVPVIDDVRFSLGQLKARLSLADDATLVYLRGNLAPQSDLVWVDRQGREDPLGLEPRDYAHPRVSPDGAQVSVITSLTDLWTYELDRKTWTPVPADGAVAMPVWSPEVDRLAFASGSGNDPNLFETSADGTGGAERLSSVIIGVPTAWSADGRHLIFYTLRTTGTTTGNDLGVLAFDGEGTAEVLLETGADERHADLSPDGRWLAYESDASGAAEVYVSPFPDAEADRMTVSAGGGEQPRWSADGRELYYWSGAGLMAVPVETVGGFAPGAPTRLFDLDAYQYHVGRNYDVAPDGRFLIVKPITDADVDAGFVLVQNWASELERLVPVE